MGAALTFETARGSDRWRLPRYTSDQVRALPARVDFVDACRAWGLSAGAAYPMAARGELPFRARKLGREWAILRSDLLESLGISDEAVEAATGGAGSGPGR